ncbi:MAG TPA: alkaline phosphatase family protein [Thermoanaerobaculia bacterium]|nr:alkaline phosphatase family protein [Thermoanaerobaculia bacterium]
MRTRTALLLSLFATVAAAQQLPHPDHVVVVVMENKKDTDVIGSPNAPYINTKLIPLGTVLTKAYALHHPSQPNYLELFAGAPLSVCTDACFAQKTAPNLAAQLRASTDPKHNTFVGYAEHFHPQCQNTPTADQYAQKHCPWRDFTNVPASVSKDFSAFPTNFDQLPAVAFVIPDLFGDMHSVDPNDQANAQILAAHHGQLTDAEEIPLEVKQGDTWLKTHMDRYARWAGDHNSLLIVTWDEDSAPHPHVSSCANGITTHPPANRIPTIFVGAHVHRGHPGTRQVTHHDLLRTILDMEGLPPFAGAVTATPITDIWQ